MAVTLTPVFRGTAPGDKTGDEPYDAFGKVNTSDSALKAGVDLVLDLPQSTILGRVTAGTGDPEKLTTAQVKTLLDLTGTNSGDQTITLTGDVTGSGTGSFAATIGANKVTYSQIQQAAAGFTIMAKATTGAGNFAALTAGTDGVLRRSGTGNLAFGTIGTNNIANSAVSLAKMANVATGTVFYRKTAATGVPEVQTLATLKTDLGLTGTNSGDQTSLTGISDTKANFDTALSDGSFMFTEVATLNDLAGVINSFAALSDGQVLTYDTTNGWQNETPAAPEIVLDTSPQLGGNLDTNSKEITSGSVVILNGVLGHSLRLNGANAYLFGVDGFYPATDGVYDLGTGSLRFDNTYFNNVQIDEVLQFTTTSTLAALPAATFTNQIAIINDALAPVNGSAITGGGAVEVVAWSNGTDWICVSGGSAAGVTDHTLLSNIGTNTHAQIDTHLALTDEHINWRGTSQDFSTSGTVNGGTIKATNGFVAALDFLEGGVSGGTALNLGANILLYGQSHATTPFDIRFRSSAVTELFFDYSGNLWDFQSNAIFTNGPITTTGTITGSSIAGNQTLNLAPAADHTYSGSDVLATLTGLAFGTVVSKRNVAAWEAADADSETLMPVVGMAASATVMILPGSFVRDDSWTWTRGDVLYASTTVGTMQTTPPAGTGDVVQVLGYAVSATVIWFNPSPDWFVNA